MKRILPLLLLVTFAVPAHAGLLDKINAATKKLNDYNARQQGGTTQSAGAQTGDSDHPLDLQKEYGKGGSCEGKRSATCMDYMEAVDKCMDPLKGYRSKVWADRLEYKLKNEKDIPADLRKNLEEDLAAFREAEKNKSNEPTIAGKPKSQRYLSDAADEDQIWVNAEYNKFNAKIMNKCQGADHMGIGRRTELIDWKNMPSGDEALAQYRAEHGLERAQFDARRADHKAKMQGMQDCMKGVQGVRWKIMADKLEAKIKAGAAGGDRKNWEADLASLRDAANNNLPNPKPANASNPNRYLQRFTTDEHMAINNEYIAGMQEVSTKCSAMAQK